MERVGSYPLRHGTKVDGRLLSELFTQLHFEVMHWLDCTAMVGVSFICSLWIFVLYVSNDLTVIYLLFY